MDVRRPPLRPQSPGASDAPFASKRVPGLHGRLSCHDRVNDGKYLQGRARAVDTEAAPTGTTAADIPASLPGSYNI